MMFTKGEYKEMHDEFVNYFGEDFKSMRLCDIRRGLRDPECHVDDLYTSLLYPTCPSSYYYHLWEYDRLQKMLKHV